MKTLNKIQNLQSEVKALLRLVEHKQSEIDELIKEVMPKPEPKYKKGDKLKCTASNTNCYIKDKIYDQFEDSDKIVVCCEHGDPSWPIKKNSNAVMFEPYTEPTEILYTGGARFKQSDIRHRVLLHCHDNNYLSFSENFKSYDLSSWRDVPFKPYSKITCEPIQPDEDLTGKWLVVDKDDKQPELCYDKKGFVTVDDRGQTLLGTQTSCDFKLVFHV